MGELAVSRAIGDHCLRPYVIAEPEVRLQGRTGSLQGKTDGDALCRLLPWTSYQRALALHTVPRLEGHEARD